MRMILGIKYACDDYCLKLICVWRGNLITLYYIYHFEKQTIVGVWLCCMCIVPINRVCVWGFYKLWSCIPLSGKYCRRRLMCLTSCFHCSVSSVVYGSCQWTVAGSCPEFTQGQGQPHPLQLRKDQRSFWLLLLHHVSRCSVLTGSCFL